MRGSSGLGRLALPLTMDFARMNGLNQRASGQVFLQQGAVFDGGLPVEFTAGVGKFQKQ